KRIPSGESVRFVDYELYGGESDTAPWTPVAGGGDRSVWEIRLGSYAALSMGTQRARRRPMRLLSLVIVTVVLLASLPVGAQQPVAPPPPQIPYGAPISLEQAKKVVAGAEAESRKNNWNMVIAVLDSGGNLVMLQRMDGVQLGSIEAAKDKAYSAVMYRRPTKVFQDLVGQGGPNLRLLRLAGASPLEGGIPIIVDGKVIGAIGVSGHTSEQDAQVAKAGADALK